MTSVQLPAVSINADSEATLEQQDIRANFAGLRADLVLVYPVESVADLKVDAEPEDDAEPAKGRLKQMIQSMKGATLKRSCYKDEVAALENRLEGRARLLLKLKEAGLTFVLEQECQRYVRQGVSNAADALRTRPPRRGSMMLVNPKEAPPTLKRSMTNAIEKAGGDGWCLRTIKELIFGKRSDRC